MLDTVIRRCEEEALAEMLEDCDPNDHDKEEAHGRADSIVCNLLRELGCTEIAELYSRYMGGYWYA